MAAADRGTPQAMFQLASALWMNKQFGEALVWHKKAHAAGHAVSAHLLGVISRDGLSTNSPDHQAARRYFEDAARLGYAPARTQLALMKMRGQGGAPDLPSAIADLQDSGRSGDPEAWENLAKLAGEQPDLLDQPAENFAALAVAARKKTAARQARASRLAARDQADRTTERTYPKRVQIEITTRCNYACVMCPHGLDGIMQHKLDAPDEIVEDVLSKIHRIEALHLTGLGEPLLAGGFWKIVDALRGRETPELVFHTNGLLLTDRNIERILAAPVRHICLSLDAATEQTYAKIRGGNFSDITAKARRLAAAAALSDRHVLLQIAMVLMAENYKEAASFVRLAHSLGFAMVSFDHLMDSRTPPGAWVVDKPLHHFHFNYHDQRILPGHPLATKCDQAVLEALDEADLLGIQVAGLNIFINENADLHKNRPCRRTVQARYFTGN
jgi:sulfatase maturation enzyme AslB (radical SAM superfamily)